MRTLAVIVCALILCLLQGCKAPSREGDPTLTSQSVRADLFTAPEVRVHRFSGKGDRISDEAFRDALVTVERHLGRSIRVIDHGEVEAWGDHGPVAPIQDQGRPVSKADVTGANGRYMLSKPDDGILGVIDMGPGGLVPLVEPGVIIVVELPGTEKGNGVTGVAGALVVDEGPTAKPASRSGLVMLHHNDLVHHSGFFVSRTKLCQWTLTHEIGHVLRVPASNSHIWIVPGLGAHCTNPNCVMYTGFDWRVLWTGLVRGWPLDYCEQCKGELAQARAEAGRGTK
jgi:hypothetical protein